MGRYDHILAKSKEHGGQMLSSHLKDVADVAMKIARYLQLDEDTARLGALLHDIGKASPHFQKTLQKGYIRRPGEVFRHEIASLFFISLVDESMRDDVIEMIVAHHKSAFKDCRKLGIIDLEDCDDSFAIHSKDFEEWTTIATGILDELGIATHPISIAEARKNYEYALDYSDKAIQECGHSQWRGLLMAADHYASALSEKTDANIDKLFIKPDLRFYERQSELYPLSMIATNDERPHTIVTAPTGAGKTDFLVRRCKGRFFYTLPFQASINAMYERFKNDLYDTDAQIYLLHSASTLKVEDGNLEESILQRHVGASIKVLTPHQMASIAFGIKGYEAMILDLQGQDVILDEIHTYKGETQAIVLKIIEVLVNIGCRVHVGTATMPTLLYEKIKQLLGGAEMVYEVSLPDKTLETFNRHIIHKVDNFESCTDIIDKAISSKQKILIVCNQVQRSQNLYRELSENYPMVNRMLLHSRFKRGDRNELETKLKDEFNKSDEACIAVSTQVVEVSLDISFDLMITECAPIDAMIQRFGRVNRKRTKETIGHCKPIYVLSPLSGNDALPYDEAVLQRSYDVLPDGEVMQETEVQQMIDTVYPDSHFMDIDYSGAIVTDGRWTLSELCHRDKAAFLDLLDIQTATCITESDEETYKHGTHKEASLCEIPCTFHSVAHRNLERIDKRQHPFVIPNAAYDAEMGLLMNNISPVNYKSFEII